jgi:hypothetical protein
MAILIRRRQDTKTNWTSENPILPLRQLVFTADAGGTGIPLIKMGDGSSTWANTPYINKKNNLESVSSPLVSDDSGQNYSVGSLWQNISDPAVPVVYICTNPASGAAVWVVINGGGGGSSTWGAITGTLSSQTDLQTALDAKVATTGNETIAGVKTFSSFPVTPSSAPTTDYQAANKKYVDDSSGTAASTSLVDTDLVVAPFTNVQDFADGIDAAVLRARGTGVSSSYVSTVAAGGTTFAQPAVSGEINSDEGYFSISYAGATGITVTTLSSPSTYVYIDNAGALQQQVTEPTRQDWSRKIFTMRVAVDTTTNLILGFEYLNNPIGHYANSIRDLYSFLLAQGVPFKKEQVITGRAGDLGFDVSAGSFFEFGGTGDINEPNTPSIAQEDNVSYALLSRTALVSTETNLVKFWDNNTVITALGSGTFVGHRVYRFANGNFAIQYGQGNYANIVLARAGILLEGYILNPLLLNATFFGWWIIGETATNTGGTTLTEFREYTIGVQGGSSSGLAGCLLQGNNLSDLLDADAAILNLGITATATELNYVDGVTSSIQAQIDAISGGTSTPFEQSFTATAAQTNFTLSNAPAAAWVWLNGAAQDASTWSISGSDIVLDTGAAVGDAVEVYYLTVAGVATSAPEEDIVGTALYEATATGTYNLDLSTFTAFRVILTGNTTLTVTNTPASGESFVRSFKISSTATETLTLPASWNVVSGTYGATTAIDDIQIEFSNFPTVGLIVTVYINAIP